MFVTPSGRNQTMHKNVERLHNAIFWWSVENPMTSIAVEILIRCSILASTSWLAVWFGQSYCPPWGIGMIVGTVTSALVMMCGYGSLKMYYVIPGPELFSEVSPLLGSYYSTLYYITYACETGCSLWLGMMLAIIPQAGWCAGLIATLTMVAGFIIVKWVHTRVVCFIHDIGKA